MSKSVLKCQKRVPLSSAPAGLAVQSTITLLVPSRIKDQTKPPGPSPHQLKPTQPLHTHPQVNRLLGLRGFNQPSMLQGGPASPESVGVYTADWQWVPCDWSHADCGFMFESVCTCVCVCAGWAGGQAVDCCCLVGGCVAAGVADRAQQRCVCCAIMPCRAAGLPSLSLSELFVLHCTCTLEHTRLNKYPSAHPPNQNQLGYAGKVSMPQITWGIDSDKLTPVAAAGDESETSGAAAAQKCGSEQIRLSN